VRKMGGYGLPSRLRLSIGTRDECDMLCEALEEFAAANPGHG